MRTAVLLVVGLAAVVACVWESPAPGAAPRSSWRRTAHGWERADDWTPPPAHWSDGIAHLHPAVVGLLQLGTSTAALLAFAAVPPGSEKNPGRGLPDVAAQEKMK